MKIFATNFDVEKNTSFDHLKLTIFRTINREEFKVFYNDKLRTVTFDQLKYICDFDNLEKSEILKMLSKCLVVFGDEEFVVDGEEEVQVIPAPVKTPSIDSRPSAPSTSSPDKSIVRKTQEFRDKPVGTEPMTVKKVTLFR